MTQSHAHEVKTTILPVRSSFRGITPLDLHNYSHHTRPYSILVIYYIIFLVGGTPYPDWNEWKVVYEIKVNKHRMSQPEHISDELYVLNNISIQ